MKAQRALADLVNQEPERHPLVVATVGAIGAPVEELVTYLGQSFQRFDYSPVVLHLAALLSDPNINQLPDRDSKDYYSTRMNAGDLLRREAKSGSAVTALAIGKIEEDRQHSEDPKPRVYLLRSLKNPDEVKLLRHIYGDAFSLVGVACSERSRRSRLKKSLSHLQDYRLEVERLMLRDSCDDEEREYGQNVRGTYSMADVYISAETGEDFRDSVDRFTDSLFGHLFLTPTPNEEAMRFAQDAALRSAAAGRQVGAALIPTQGTPVVAGCNEVPRPGGGQYWAGDDPDHRDFQSGEDPNPIFSREVLEEVFDRLAGSDWLSEQYSELTGSELAERAVTAEARGAALLAHTRATSLIEFTRCLHAEQAAIINAARAGIPTTGSVLFSTTFPCHECAKMIVGAGIAEVQYIVPYPKSLVDQLYDELIDTSPGPKVSRRFPPDKVPFYQFVGIAPRHYTRAFSARKRQDGLRLATFDRKRACPTTDGWSPQRVKQQESAAVVAINRVIDQIRRKTSDDVPEVVEHAG